MAPSDSHQSLDVKNPDSEVIVATTDLDGVSKNSKDFINDWLNVNVTVHGEILRGQKLREGKPAPHGKEKECFVPEINIYGPFVNQRRGRKCNCRSQKRTSPCSSRTKSPKRATSPASTYFSASRCSKANQSKTKFRGRCPMRIAELAVPTKRQCIDTWRQKSNVLPEIMVERLKQQVLDQTPIVKIPEAIYCFQRGRFTSSKKCSFKWLSDKIKQYENQLPKHHTAARILCIIFAKRVSKILSNPMNLTLTPELEKLSQIVSSDIAKIMPQHRCTFKRNPQYEAIHTDISNKIAVWIAGIIEDTAVKLLEEELRVKMETEAQREKMLQFSNQFHTICKTISQPEQKVVSKPTIKSKDLEEEEGPVLDFIDDVVDNVMNVCEPPQLQIESGPDSSVSSKDELLEQELERLTPIESSDTKLTKLTTEDETFKIEEASQGLTEETDDSLIGDMKHLSDSEHFQNEIGIIIDNITKEFGNDITNEEISSKAEMEQDINYGTNEVVSPQAEIQRDINDEHIRDDSDLREASMQQDISDGNYEKLLLEAEGEHNIKNEDILPGAGIEQDINDASTGQITDIFPNTEYTDNTHEKTNSNVSERFQIFSDDSDDDTNSKKVMFSKTDLVNPETYAAQIKYSTTEILSESDELLQEQWTPQNNKSIIFSEPNERLLSYADESWPYDLGGKSYLKISESAHKSVSSLGNITEYDEKQMSTPDLQNNDADKRTVDTELQVNSKDLDSMFPTAKYDTARQSKEPPMKAFPKTSTLETQTIVSQDNAKLIKESGKTTPVKSNVESFKLSKNHETDTGKSDLIQKGSTADRREDKATPTPKRQSQMGYDWKVHPKTAPSWVSSWGQGRGEPSEDSSIKIQRRPTKVTEDELRRWCKELEKAFKNLEMWSNWISATCQESLRMMRQKDFACPAMAQKGAINRIRHKKDVRKDALLWTKLYQRTETNFKSLKKKYDNVEYSSNEPTSILKETVFDMICEFENRCMELHKMIVAAEYCAVCKCNKTKTKFNFKKENNTK